MERTWKWLASGSLTAALWTLCAVVCCVSIAQHPEYIAAGLSVGAIVNHDHYTVMAPLAAHHRRGLELSVAPGLEWERRYTTHLSAAYVVDRGPIEIGPAFELSHSSEGRHLDINLHCSFHL